MKYYILTYGSLREGGNWFNDLKSRGSIKKIETLLLYGFSIYNLKDETTNEIYDYVACKITTSDSYIVADIVEVDKNIYDYISKVMNHSNFDKFVFNVKSKQCIFYIYGEKVDLNLKINTGNYFSKLNKKILLNNVNK